jgi:hypothetical protein
VQQRKQNGHLQARARVVESCSVLTAALRLCGLMGWYGYGLMTDQV